MIEYNVVTLLQRMCPRLKNPVVLFLPALLSIFLFLLCVALILLIINMLKTHRDYFFFRSGSRLYNLAFMDDLTQLFNRNAYIRDLAKLKTEKLTRLWFCIFDIDDFKTINDTKGHRFGDETLVAAANRLCTVFADKHHTVYRLGGDEFLVISKNIDEDELVALLLQLKDIELERDDFRLSKGYSFVQMKELGCFNTAFDNADKMLYADKNSKKQPASN